MSDHIYNEDQRINFYLSVVDQEYEKILQDPASSHVLSLVDKYLASVSEIKKIVTDEPKTYIYLSLILALKLFNNIKDASTKEMFLAELRYSHNIATETVEWMNDLYNFLYSNDSKLLDKILKKESYILEKLKYELFKLLIVAKTNTIEEIVSREKFKIKSEYEKKLETLKSKYEKKLGILKKVTTFLSGVVIILLFLLTLT